MFNFRFCYEQVRRFYYHCSAPEPPKFSQLSWRQRQIFSLRAGWAFVRSHTALRMSLWLIAWQLAVQCLIWKFDCAGVLAVWMACSAGIWVWPWLKYVRQQHISRLLDLSIHH